MASSKQNSFLGKAYYSIKDTYPDLSFPEFCSIINEFGKEASHALIHKGEKLKLNNIGTLRIAHKKRDYGYTSINYYESKKLKKEIIDNGGIPLENYKDSQGNIIGDNGGESWLVFFSDPDIFYFIIGENRKVKVGDYAYWFTPTFTNKRNLAAFVKENTGTIYETVH